MVQPVKIPAAQPDNLGLLTWWKEETSCCELSADLHTHAMTRACPPYI